MKIRRYSVLMTRVENHDYLGNYSTAIGDIYHPIIRPTVHDITAWVAGRFPDMKIDETYEPLSEQLSGACSAGIFSITLRKPEDNRNTWYNLSFMEA